MSSGILARRSGDTLCPQGRRVEAVEAAAQFLRVQSGWEGRGPHATDARRLGGEALLLGGLKTRGQTKPRSFAQWPWKRQIFCDRRRLFSGLLTHSFVFSALVLLGVCPGVYFLHETNIRVLSPMPNADA